MAPVLIYLFSGLNMYDTYSYKDSFSYSECYSTNVEGAVVRPLFHIRTCLATILFNLIVLLLLFNYNKLSGSVARKALMGATCVIVRGGFEGLGDPDLDAQQETAKPRRMNSSHSPTALEVERNSLSDLEYARQIENRNRKLEYKRSVRISVGILATTGFQINGYTNEERYQFLKTLLKIH